MAQNFIARNSFSLRKVNCTGKDLPRDIAITNRGFIENCKEKRAHYSRVQIYGWDESFVEIDSPESYTYDKKAKRKFGQKQPANIKQKFHLALQQAQMEAN